MGKVRRGGHPAPAIWRVAIDPFSRRDVIGTFLIVASSVSVLALISPAGAIGRLWYDQLRTVFGAGAYLAPAFFGGLGVALLRTRFAPSYLLKAPEIAGWLMLYAVFESLLQAINGDVVMPSVNGGGLVGWSIRFALVGAVGAVGASIVLGLVALVAIALILDLTPGDIWHFAVGVARQAQQSVAERFFPHFTVHQRGTGVSREPRAPTLAPKPPRPSTASSSAKASANGATSAPPAVDADGRPLAGWELPPVSLLQHGVAGELSQADISRKVKQIEETLADFDVPARVVEVNPGPTVTQFGLEPGFREKRDRAGNVIRRDKVKVSEITALTNDLALALAAPTVRIEAPVPGRSVVGIEVPNNSTTVVSLRQIIESTPFQRLLTKGKLPIALGEDVAGQPIAADLTRMPHLLIAGATGTGKSVCMNALITCLLLHTTPDELRLLLIDPKRVELTGYNDVPHLLRPVVVDVDKVVGVLKWAVHEMEDRYKRFEACGVRNIDGYNRRAANDPSLKPLPYIVIVIDELADLMMLAPDDVERLICRLAQLARATGMHLVVATQRPSVDVITGLIKANFPTRISFAVTSQVDSRTILDTTGAEKLLGRGDMLYLPTDAAKPLRLQGTFVSDDEIEAIVQSWHRQGAPRYDEQLVNVPSFSADDGEEDDLYDRAVELADQFDRLSASLLQRRLRIGYNRAVRLLEQLEQNGVIGSAEGGKSREVIRREDAATPSQVPGDPVPEADE